MVSRADRSRFAEWFWTVDHYLLAAFGLLLLAGVVFAFAASPPVAERIGVDTLYFVKRQAMFTVPALVIMLGGSLMTPRMVPPCCVAGVRRFNCSARCHLVHGI